MAKTPATLAERFRSARTLEHAIFRRVASSFSLARPSTIALATLIALGAVACQGGPSIAEDTASADTAPAETLPAASAEPNGDAVDDGGPSTDGPRSADTAAADGGPSTDGPRSADTAAADGGQPAASEPSTDFEPAAEEPPAAAPAVDERRRAEPLPYDNEHAINVLRTLAVEIGPRVQGTSGEAAAADFLDKTFTSFGYTVERQRFRVPSFDVEALDVRVGGNVIEATAFSFSAGGSVSGPLVVVAGLGTADDYASVDVRGGIALVERGILFFSEKVANAAEAGAVGIIIFNNEVGALQGNLGAGSQIPAVGVSRADGRSVAADAAAGPVEASIELAGGFSLTDSQNVIASRGDDQCGIYVGGHYDTVPDVPGANDNASGTALVIELARAFAGSPGVEGVCFVGFGGEEGVAGSPGIAGSAALVDDLVERGVAGAVAAMMNLDVVAAGNALVLVGTPTLVAIADAIAEEIGVDARPGSLPMGSGSDHINFQKAGIPVIFPSLTGAVIHTPADNFDAVDSVLFNGVGQLAHAMLRCLIGQEGGQAPAPASCPLAAS